MFHVFVFVLSVQFCRATVIQKTTPTSYGVLENIQFGATTASRDQYPWIGAVIHSRFNDIPHVCTAICIDEAIFITAARCIYSLKIKYTTIQYMNSRLRTIAFVVPTVVKSSAGMFDDIGFIVVNTTNFKEKWHVIELINRTNRTDNVFGDWYHMFLSIPYGMYAYKAVGFAKSLASLHPTAQLLAPYPLMELNVNIDLEFTTPTYHTLRLPYYHACHYSDWLGVPNKCNQYLGAEGTAVYDTKSKKLLGVATWAPGPINLPNTNKWNRNPVVGFSVANSPNFYEDWVCAKLIRDDKTMGITTGHYQRLCDKL